MIWRLCRAYLSLLMWKGCGCRVKQYHSRSAQYEQILKKNEQMYALTAITLALCPAAQRELDETVMNTLKDKCVRAASLASSTNRICAQASFDQSIRHGSLVPKIAGPFVDNPSALHAAWGTHVGDLACRSSVMGVHPALADMCSWSPISST